MHAAVQALMTVQQHESLLGDKAAEQLLFKAFSCVLGRSDSRPAALLLCRPADLASAALLLLWLLLWVPCCGCCCGCCST